MEDVSCETPGNRSIKYNYVIRLCNSNYVIGIGKVVRVRTVLPLSLDE